MRSATVLGFLGLFSLGVFGAYPSTFPFENEAYQAPGLVASTPNLDFAPETDNGGYVYFYGITVTTFTVRDGTPGAESGDSKFPTVGNGHYMYGLVNQFSAPPVLPASLWNCTKKEIVFSAADYTGMVDGNKVCEVGQCCSDYYGLVKYSDDPTGNHDWLDKRHSNNMCGDVWEIIYCTLVMGDAYGNCMEYVTGPDERLIVTHCYDSWVLYSLTCQVFKNGVYAMKYIYEPDSYMEQLNVEQQMVLDLYARLQDQLCKPYSYFFPSSTSGSSGETSDGGDDSSSGIVSAFFLAFVLATFV